MKNIIVLLGILGLIACDSSQDASPNPDSSDSSSPTASTGRSSLSAFKEALSFFNPDETQTVSITHWERITKDFEFYKKNKGLNEFEYPFDFFLYEFPKKKAEEILGFGYEDVAWEANSRGFTLFKLNKTIETKVLEEFVQKSHFESKTYKGHTYYHIGVKEYYSDANIIDEEVTTLQMTNVMYWAEKQLFVIARNEPYLEDMLDLVEDKKKNFYDHYELKLTLKQLADNYTIYLSTEPVQYPTLELSLMDLATKEVAEDPEKYKAFMNKILGVDKEQVKQLNTYQFWAMGLSYQGAIGTTLFLQYENKEQAKKDFPIRLAMEEKGASFYDGQPLKEKYPVDVDKSQQQGKCIVLRGKPLQPIINRLATKDLLALQIP